MMPIAHWLRPPRHLLVLFLGGMLALLAGVAWLAWRSLEQDRAVEVQRVRARLESTTDLIASEIRQRLTGLEDQLAQLAALSGSSFDQAVEAAAKAVGDDALMVLFDLRAVRAYPDQRLLYYPTLPIEQEPVLTMFSAGEEYEFEAGDFASAIEHFQQLANAGDEAVRAGALVRLARNQRKAGQPDAALATYSRLSRLENVTVGGRPADLMARRARCALLEELGRRAELVDEARRLDQDLHRGRWPLTRPTYVHFAADTERWLASSVPTADGPRGPSRVARALASAVESLWGRWQTDPRAPDMLAGRNSLRSDDGSVFLIWRATADRLVAVAAGPRFLEHSVINVLSGIIERERVGVVLADGEGQAIVSHELKDPAGQNVLRTMADTRLPWTLRVVSADPEIALTQLAARRRLFLGGLGFLATLVMAGSYFSARAITREMEAARLQADFVAAVSHEFRTPLTLLRQFSDLLAEGRVTSEEERHQYYEALQRGTRRLTRLVENVLDFRRTEAGAQMLALAPLNVKDWIERVSAEFQEEVRGQGYRIEIEWLAPAAMMVRADEAALGRALWNLLDNAVKYSPSCKTIWVSGMLDESALTIAVRDRGIGVPTEEQGRIFGKFVRGSSPGGLAVKGTGLGLALVEQIVTGHTGRIGLESAVGEGSTFTIHLPAYQ